MRFSIWFYKDLEHRRSDQIYLNILLCEENRKYNLQFSTLWRGEEEERRRREGEKERIGDEEVRRKGDEVMKRRGDEDE